MSPTLLGATSHRRVAIVSGVLAVLAMSLWALSAVGADECLVLSGHRDRVAAVAFSPDGTTLASGGLDCTIILWDPRTGKELTVLDPPEGRFPGVMNTEGTVYDDIDGISPPFIGSLSFSSDGKGLAAGALDESIRVWDVAGKKQRLKVKLPYSGPNKLGNAVTGVAFAPDAKSIASATEDKVIRLWSSDKGKLIRELRGHTGEVYAVAFAPDGKSLASCGADATVRVWDVQSGEAKRLLKPSACKSVGCIAISSDGSYLAASVVTDDEEGRALYLWDYRTGKLLTKFDGYRMGPVAFSPNGSILAAGTTVEARKGLLGSSEKRGEVILWDVAKRREIAKLKGHKNGVTSVAFSPDGKLLASASDNSVRVWRVERFSRKP